VAALSLGSFPLLCAAYFVYGLHRACLVSLDALASGALSSRGPSVLLIGTLAGAILGPALGYWGRGGTIPFAASFGLLLGGMAVQAVVAATLPDVRREETSRIGLSHRPWGQRLADPALWLAAGAPALSSGLVVLFLAVLPLAMREHGHPLSSSTLVLQAFGLGVCASRVISSRLWKRWEARRLMAWGIVLFAAASLTSWAGTDLWPFAVALTLLGFGWNLLLVGGASLLAKVHRPTENTGVQVFRDSLVYGFAAVASLGAGLGERTLGWSGLQLLTIPILGVLVVLLLVNRSPKKPVDS
jgi:predicted MFS family arabinose efflux permease